jgi:hypothetical protein
MDLREAACAVRQQAETGAAKEKLRENRCLKRKAAA